MISDKPRMRSPFSLIFRISCILFEEQLLKKIYAHSELSYLHFSVARTAKIAQLSKGPHSPALLCLCRLNAMKTITPSALLLLAAEALFCMHLPCVCCYVFTDKCMKALFSFQQVNPDVNCTRIFTICKGSLGVCIIGKSQHKFLFFYLTPSWKMSCAKIADSTILEEEVLICVKGASFLEMWIWIFLSAIIWSRRK